MHGRVCDDRSKGRRHRHMLRTSSRVTASLEADGSTSLSLPSSTSFRKDGRIISVGDCALFKPPKDSPPFIGIIRLVIAERDKKLKLVVNWLYRPAEIKLGKGILLEAAPNEIFYSFHEDEIPAASLLHPCKVAFLPRGVELPSGICSFICRRVYDVTNERLCWLTDKDYIDDRQEEVDQLLCKTRSEMHTTSQQGGCSPKSMNSPTTSQLKPGRDGIQTNTSFSSSHGKGRKRERMDQSSESVKRERSSRIDDSGSGALRTDSSLKSEIVKITEKGGMVDVEGVEKLVQLMLPERSERKIDLVSRSMLAGVIAATDKFDCLSRFVQLRGLPIFDAWLQEVHKGKIGGGSSPKDSDRSVEDFLVILLRALDKLPVNLNALQTCNIGKSVNYLRSHKNLEIQKKARSIVDTWKKRVEAEMDAKSGSNQGASWPGKSRHSEVSHGGRHSGGSADAPKTSATHLHACKSASLKVQVENCAKSIATSPSCTRSAQSPGSGCTTLREGHQRNAGAGDVPIAVAKDEKSCSSSQSHNNSQSCSSEHAKTGSFSGKEDARSSTAGSKTANKSSGGSSRHRKSINGFQGSTSSAALKETRSSRSSSSQRNATSGKLSHSTLTSDKTLEVPVADGCSNKVIVKLPDRGRSPAQSVSGGSFEDPAAVNSRASSPVLSEKHDQYDHNMREKNDAYRANFCSDINAESWQSNDFKDVLTGSDEAAGSPNDQRCRNVDVDDSTKVAGVVKAASPPSGSELKSGKMQGGSLSSMNALIESCVRYCEANACVPGGDDVGMNLLASVAAEEMSKSLIASPSVSHISNSSVIQKNSSGNHTKLIASSIDDLPREQHDGVAYGTNVEDDDHDKQHVSSSGMLSTDSENMNDSKPGDLDESSNSEIEDLQRLVDQCLESHENSDDVASTPLPVTDVRGKMFDDNQCEVVDDQKADVVSYAGCISDTTRRIDSTVLSECKVTGLSRKVDAVGVEHSLSSLAGDCNKEQKPQTLLTSESDRKMEDVAISSDSAKDKTANNDDSMTTKKTNDIRENHKSQSNKLKNKGERDSFASMAVTKHVRAGLASSLINGKAEHVEENLESIDINKRCSGAITPQGVSPKGAGEHRRPDGWRVVGAGGDEAEECTSVVRDVSSVSASVGSEIDARVEFDLNEGFDGEDSRIGDSNNITGPVTLTSAPLQLVNSLSFSVPAISCGFPASITVTAAAKGPFVPPEDLLRNKGTFGWKGSAATSAFRPAEPRKVQEVPVCMSNASTSDASISDGKQTRMLLDIDLNVPDERVLEDLASQRSGNATNSTSGLTDSFHPSRSRVMGSAAPAHSSGGLDLDLNKVDYPTDMNNYNMSGGHRLDMSFQPSKLLSGERRDFDLNDGPAVDDVNTESSMSFSQYSRNSLPSHPTLSSIRANGENMASFSSLFPGANTFPAVSIPPTLPDRGDQPFPVIATGTAQRILGPSTGVSSYTPDVYRGPILSSSPAVPFQSTMFQYPVFPFGSSFPLASATFSGGSMAYMDSSSSGRLCFPTVNSQILGPAVAVPSNYPRPYIVGLPNGGNNAVSDNNVKWFRSGLDLNSGPGVHETDARDESTLVPRQMPSSASQSLKDDQARTYQMSGGVLKRKESDGGWDGYKQSWK